MKTTLTKNTRPVLQAHQADQATQAAPSAAPRRSRLPMAAAALALCTFLGACAPLMVGSVVGGAMMAVDRRTSGNQVEDQTIELKALQRVRDTVGSRGHVSITSYNRIAMITGEAATEADQRALEQAVAGIEGVRSVVNETAVMGSSSLSTRSSDTVISGRIKAAYLDAKDLQSNAIKVVTERGNVYLMGRVTEREAGRAAELARTVPGVQKVVRVFELISEAELAAMQPPPAAK